MKIKVIDKEETGRVRYVAVDVEVTDGDAVYELSATISESYDENSRSIVKETEVIWDDDIVISDKQKEEVEEKVKEYLEGIDL